jgi:hypothetical protein
MLIILKNPGLPLIALRQFKNDNIFVINKDYADIPGPRFIYLLKDFSEIFKSYRK